MYWSYLVQLGFKMWPYWRMVNNFSDSRITDPSVLLFDKSTWDDLIPRLRDAGCNMLIIDLGEGMRFDSHPELAVKGSWDKGFMKEELDKLRKMGITPVPKLNFSAGHDEWLGIYERMVSTPTYYKVVSDVIRETAEVFGNSCPFHIGMDEEHFSPESTSLYQVQRCHELWWEDFNFIANEVRSAGCTPMMWPDMFWHKSEVFIEKAPRDIIMCNWYYGDEFPDNSVAAIKAYDWLEKGHCIQMPTGSILYPDSLKDTVRYCREIITPDLLYGFMQAPWYPTIKSTIEKHIGAIDALANARKEWEKQ